MILKKINHCARCGQDHVNIEYEVLTYPIEDSDGVEWTHWAKCPTNGQPILIKIEPEKDAQ